MASKDANRMGAKDEKPSTKNTKIASSSKNSSKDYVPKLIVKAAQYKAALELHGEHLEAHLKQLKGIQERHSLVTDKILPKMGLMGESLQSRMEVMQKKVDRLRNICLEIERDQAAEETKPKPPAEETPSETVNVNPQVLHDMGLEDLSHLVTDEVVKLVCKLAIRGAPIADTSPTSHPTTTPTATFPPDESFTFQPSAAHSITTQHSAETPPALSSPPKTYKERQKERRKQRKAEKAKLQKEQAQGSASSQNVFVGRRVMKEKKLAMKKVRRRLRSREFKEYIIGSRTVKVLGDVLYEIGVAIRWAPYHLQWIRSLQQYDMETRWRLRTRRYAFC
ncbi:hypothetical protein F4811DRAFT_517258 [Daldinia bambusicola]|nr:hypothetical protein F4811DRAFT_517258 [Daldinia bambusicola]